MVILRTGKSLALECMICRVNLSAIAQLLATYFFHGLFWSVAAKYGHSIKVTCDGPGWFSHAEDNIISAYGEEIKIAKMTESRLCVLDV